MGDANGVPQLFGGASLNFGSVVLLTADILTDFSASFGPEWGVYLNGAPIILFDTFLSIDYRQTWNLSDYPVERGGFESYNKVYTPFETRVSFATGGSEAHKAAMLASVAAIAGTLLLYDVVTPEVIYQSVNVKHYDYRRTATNGLGLLRIELWLEEVRVTVSEASTTTSGTGDSGGAAPPADSSGSSSFDESGFAPQDPSGANPNNNGVTPPIEIPGLENTFL